MSRWLIACDYPTGTSGESVTSLTNKSKDTLNKHPKEVQVVQVNPGFSKEDTEIKSTTETSTQPTYTNKNVM